MGVSGGSATAGDTGDLTLPVAAGSIEGVAWSAASASGDQPIPLSAKLVGFDTPPSSVSFEIWEFVGLFPPTVLLTTLHGKLDGNDATATWTPPEENPPLFVIPRAVAGDVFAFGLPLAVDQRWLSQPVFDPDQAKLGDKVTLKVQTHGYAAGTAIKLRVCDWNQGADIRVVDTVQATAGDDGIATAEWTIPNTLELSNQNDVVRRRDGDPHWGQEEPVADTTAKVQQFLRALFVRKKIDKDPGPSDGIVGDKTNKAVVDFKKKFYDDPKSANAKIDDDFRSHLAHEYQKIVEDGEDPAAEATDTAGLPGLYLVADAPGHTHAGPLLHVVPPYSIALEVMEPTAFALPLPSANDDADAAKAESRRALKQRLQAIGAYYEPLPKDAPEKDATTPRFKTAAKIFADENGVTLGKDEEPASNEGFVDAVTKKLLPAHLARADGKDFDRDDDRVMLNGRDCKLFFPGGLALQKDADFDGPSHRFARQKDFFERNGMLGKVGLLAAVWQRDLTGKDSWVPARAGVRIVFELIPPFDGDPDANDLAVLGAGQDANGADNLNLDARPKDYVSAIAKKAFDGGDPQRLNAPLDLGGKRGLPVAGSIFALGDLGLGDRWPWKAEEGPTANSVVVATTVDGHAAVCFTPSILGGEVYRVRAYVEAGGDPGAAPAPGADATDDSFSEEGKPATTGRLTVWRTVRLGRYLRWDVPLPVDAGILDEFCGLDRAAPAASLQTIDVKGVVAPELRKAFLEVDVAGSATTPQTLASSTMEDAKGFATKMVAATAGLQGLPALSWADLFTKDSSLPFTLTMRDFDAYNTTARPKGAALIDPTDLKFWVKTWPDICQLQHTHFMRYFTGDADPRFTVFQGLAGDEPSYSVDFEMVVLELPAQLLGTAADPRGTRITNTFRQLATAVFPRLAAGDSVVIEMGHTDGSTTRTPATPLGAAATLGGIFTAVRLAFATAKNADGTDKYRLTESDGTPYFAVGALEHAAMPGDPEKEVGLVPFRALPNRGGGTADPSAKLIKVTAAGDDVLETWDVVTIPGVFKNGVPSGLAVGVRGAFVYYGKGMYNGVKFPYPIGKNAAHEVGHLLYLRHAKVGNDSERPHDHDAGDKCLMSYQKGASHYCGKCLLNLRGWDVNAIKPNPGGKLG